MEAAPRAPSSTSSCGGAVPSGPQSPLEIEAVRFSGLWNVAREPRQKDPLSIGALLPFESPSAIRGAAKTCPLGAATSADGTHARHFAAVSDGALVLLVRIYRIMEATAVCA